MQRKYEEAKDLVSAVLDTQRPLKERLNLLDRLLNEYNYGFPTYRHPFLLELLVPFDHLCLDLFVRTSMFFPDQATTTCKVCSRKHIEESIPEEDTLSLRLFDSFCKATFLEDTCWDDLISFVKIKSQDPVKAYATSIPLQLQKKAYEFLFDPSALSSWSSFIEHLQSDRIKVEWTRCVLSESITASKTTPRAFTLLCKAVINVLTGPYDQRYVDLIRIDLGPELQELCLGRLQSAEGSQLYSLLSSNK